MPGRPRWCGSCEREQLPRTRRSRRGFVLCRCLPPGVLVGARGPTNGRTQRVKQRLLRPAAVPRTQRVLAGRLGPDRTPCTSEPLVSDPPTPRPGSSSTEVFEDDRTPKTVYVQYTLGIQRGATPENTRPLLPFWTDARRCPSGATWDVPGDGGEGAVEVNSKTWAMPFDGFVVGVGGHMHDGGISITTEHEDGTVMCENVAGYADGMIDTISACPMHDSIRANELLRVTSRYDNSEPHAAVMGMAVLYLWQGDQGTPPSSTTTATPSTSPSTTSTEAARPATATPTFAG